METSDQFSQRATEPRYVRGARPSSKFSRGDRVSVPREHFDSSEENPYSNSLPRHISRIIGTVIFIYAKSRRVRIKWDIDGQCSDEKFDDLLKEEANNEIQVSLFILCC